MSLADTIKTFLEHAPESGPTNPHILGWWIHHPAGDEYICGACYGRITARGCSVPADAVVPVWDDQTHRCGHRCVGCGKS